MFLTVKVGTKNNSPFSGNEISLDGRIFSTKRAFAILLPHTSICKLATSSSAKLKSTKMYVAEARDTYIKVCISMAEAGVKCYNKSNRIVVYTLLKE